MWWPFNKRDPSKDAGGGVDGVSLAPSRAERKQCWDKRDAYFACLDKHEIIFPPGLDPVEDRSKVTSQQTAKLDSQLEEEREKDPCAKLRNKYEANCAKTWIDYFNRRRVNLERQKRAQEKAAEIGGTVAQK